MGAELHGVAGVEQYGQQAVGFAAKALQIQPLASGVDVPIDVAKIVAGIVGAIFGELLAETEVGRAVQAGDEAIDHGLGDQIEAGDAGEDGGIEEALLHEELSAIRLLTRAVQTNSDYKRTDNVYDCEANDASSKNMDTARFGGGAGVPPRAVAQPSHSGYSENRGRQAEPFGEDTASSRWKAESLRALADRRRSTGDVGALNPWRHKWRG